MDCLVLTIFLEQSCMLGICGGLEFQIPIVRFLARISFQFLHLRKIILMSFQDEHFDPSNTTSLDS